MGALVGVRKCPAREPKNLNLPLVLAAVHQYHLESTRRILPSLCFESCGEIELPLIADLLCLVRRLSLPDIRPYNRCEIQLAQPEDEPAGRAFLVNFQTAEFHVLPFTLFEFSCHQIRVTITFSALFEFISFMCFEEFIGLIKCG